MENPLNQHLSMLTSATVSWSGKYAASGSKFGSICLWNTLNGANITFLQVSEKRITNLKFSPND